MISAAVDTFYLTDEQLHNSPSRKDGIDEATETTLRIYGCDLIQESGILLRLYPFDNRYLSIVVYSIFVIILTSKNLAIDSLFLCLLNNWNNYKHS